MLYTEFRKKLVETILTCVLQVIKRIAHWATPSSTASQAYPWQALGQIVMASWNVVVLRSGPGRSYTRALYSL